MVLTIQEQPPRVCLEHCYYYGMQDGPNALRSIAQRRHPWQSEMESRRDSPAAPDPQT